MCKIVIVGAGGLGRETLLIARDVCIRQPSWRIKGFLDRNPQVLTGFDCDAGVIGDDDYQPVDDDRLVIAVGDPALRHRLAMRFADRGARFATLVHPLAYVAATARVSEGAVISPFCHVADRAEVGPHVLLNTYSSAGHDSRVGACSVFSPYATANGDTRLGERVFLGTHAVVTPGIGVGNDAKIAAGAVTYRQVPDGHLAMGNPAKAYPNPKPGQA